MKKTTAALSLALLTAAVALPTAPSATAAAKDVRQVLTYVETGNADAGFVYKTDALTSGKVKIALRIIPDVHSPILYPAGVLKETKHASEANAFYAYLQTKEAEAVFVKYGFRLS